MRAREFLQEARLPQAIEEFLDSLNPDDCGVDEIGAYRIHYEGFTSDCKSSADYRRDPEAVYQQVYQDFIQREGGAQPLLQDMVGDEDFPVLFSIFRRKPIKEIFDRPVKSEPAAHQSRSRFKTKAGEHNLEVFFKNTARGLEINFSVDGRGFALDQDRGKPGSTQTLMSAINVILARLPEAVAYFKPRRVWYKSIGTDAGRVKLYNRLLPVLQRALGPEWRASTEQHPGWNLYYLDRQQKVKESEQATAQQVLAYINQTHHEPFHPGSKMHQAVMAHPRWELVQVPLLNIYIPDQEYDDMDPDYEPDADPYGRVMMVEPGHAGEVSANLIDRFPIVIDADRYIIDGNHRAWAAKYLLNRDYIQAWRPVAQAIMELGGRGELKVYKRIQNYFFKRGYGYAGEGRDQMAFTSPRGTVVKVLGIGNPEREKIVRDYVRFFEQNQQDPYIPKIYSSSEFTVSGKTYFVYEMEYLNYIANEEETLDYIENLMAATARGRHREFMASRPVPGELDKDDIPGLIQATLKLERAIGGQAPLDLSMIENLRRRDNGQIVIMDPYSL